MMALRRSDSRVTMPKQGALIVGESGDAGEHLDRTGDGRERIANLMSDAGGEASDGGEAVAETEFALEVANLGEVGKGVDVADGFAARGRGGRCSRRRSAFHRRWECARAPRCGVRWRLGRMSEKSSCTRRPASSCRAAAEQIFGGRIDQLDGTVQIGGDEAAGDGVHDDLMQELKVLQLERFVLQGNVGLAHAVRQLVGKVGDGKVGEEVDEDDRLQRFKVRTGAGVGANHIEVRELKDSAKQDERHSGGEIGPGFRQQGTGDNDDEGIEEVERGVDAAGDVNDAVAKNRSATTCTLDCSSPVVLRGR